MALCCNALLNFVCWIGQFRTTDLSQIWRFSLLFTMMWLLVWTGWRPVVLCKWIGSTSGCWSLVGLTKCCCKENWMRYHPVQLFRFKVCCPMDCSRSGSSAAWSSGTDRDSVCVCSALWLSSLAAMRSRYCAHQWRVSDERATLPPPASSQGWNWAASGWHAQV